MMNRPDTLVGVLVAQLGTPDAPTPDALRPYLKQFLSDMRVVDLNPFLWQVILRLGILPRRPVRSAALYQRIWTPQGSPLLVHSRAQVQGLQERLGTRFKVVLGMRYGSPSIRSAVQSLVETGIDRILAFPMFPQFSSTTTASIYDAVNTAAGGRRCPLFHERKRDFPTLRFVPPYYDHPGYINALRAIVVQTVEQMTARPDQYIFSFHGIPQRYADEGDPYPQQCQATANLLARALGLAPDQWTMTFQSQFGRERWLMPYTEAVLHELGSRGAKTVVAACPGFTADCLETLDEIGREGAEHFQQAGGETLHLAPGLNSHPQWLDTMAQIVRQESSGWVEYPPVSRHALPQL